MLKKTVVASAFWLLSSVVSAVPLLTPHVDITATHSLFGSTLSSDTAAVELDNTVPISLNDNNVSFSFLTDSLNSNIYNLTLTALTGNVGVDSYIVGLVFDLPGKNITDFELIGGATTLFASASGIPFTSVVTASVTSISYALTPFAVFNLNAADTFKITTNNTPTIPEPATLALFGLGLLGAAAASRSKPIRSAC